MSEQGGKLLKHRKRQRGHSTATSRSSAANPLARARGSQQQPDQIWFRRTGAGYHLFLEYYAGQPTGILGGSDNEAGDMVLTERQTIMAAAIITGSRHNGNPGAGQSRAAKRRQKKGAKAANPQAKIELKHLETTRPKPPLQQEQTANKNCNNKYSLDDKHATTKDVDHPLTQAFQHKIKNLKHQSRHTSKYLALKPCIQALVQPLPLTFRLRASLLPPQRDALQCEIHKRFPHLVKPLSIGLATTSTDGDKGENLKMIFQGRNQLSKNRLAQTHPDLHQFLLQHSHNGNIARQELGSMLPVLALAKLGCFATKKCRVLDLCASPGSKTLQALEHIVVGGGRIVANDVSPARFQALQDAVKRSGMPEEQIDRFLGYTCQDATKWTAPNATSKPWNVIICDVPCSGDGTIRKDKHILPMWKPSLGHALHSTQVRLLTRGLQLLAPGGGVLSYSTCSLNPIENEAVVAAAMMQFNKKSASHEMNLCHDSSHNKPAVELIDFPDLEGFQKRPGVSSWSVADILQSSNGRDEEKGTKKHKTDAKDAHTSNEKDGSGGDDDGNDDGEIPRLQWYKCYQEAVHMEHAVPSMWPPPYTESPELHLERCTRLWPQDHDSGGFFVALLRRNW